MNINFNYGCKIFVIYNAVFASNTDFKKISIVAAV